MSAKNLKIILFEKKLTQRQLAKDAGIPEAHLSYYMHDKFVFNKQQRNRIANALGVPEQTIFRDSKQ